MCKLCSYGDPKFSHPQLQLQQAYLHSDLHQERGSLLITTENTIHKHSFACFYSKQGFSFSRLKVFGRLAPHWCSWPERCSFFFCIFNRINWERPIVCDKKIPTTPAMLLSKQSYLICFSNYPENKSKRNLLLKSSSTFTNYMWLRP